MFQLLIYVFTPSKDVIIYQRFLPLESLDQQPV